mmetsp:Transcript_38599/g.125223  ORF Transcript_38599/g.125223 Transcript_38599/m.125223 type:complete len:289 (+) Transcript_38599:148-1014(+)
MFLSTRCATRLASSRRTLSSSMTRSPTTLGTDGRAVLARRLSTRRGLLACMSQSQGCRRATRRSWESEGSSCLAARSSVSLLGEPSSRRRPCCCATRQRAPSTRSPRRKFSRRCVQSPASQRSGSGRASLSRTGSRRSSMQISSSCSEPGVSLSAGRMRPCFNSKVSTRSSGRLSEPLNTRPVENGLQTLVRTPGGMHMTRMSWRARGARGAGGCGWGKCVYVLAPLAQRYGLSRAVYRKRGRRVGVLGRRDGGTRTRGGDGDRVTDPRDRPQCACYLPYPAPPSQLS